MMGQEVRVEAITGWVIQEVMGTRTGISGRSRKGGGRGSISDDYDVGGQEVTRQRMNKGTGQERCCFSGKGKGLLGVLSFLGISWGNKWPPGGVSRNCPTPEGFASFALRVCTLVS